MELVEQLWKKFNTEPLISFKEIPVGFKNRSYLIETTNDKKYVLKIYALNFLNDEIINSDLDIVSYLNKNAIPVLAFVKGLDGKFLQIIECEDDSKRYQAT